ncbi:MAG: T9SS type A sorting domain-containing protein [Cryomorphaceae bacterium]|nr:T9SS type A sorting domain-containing protein [Cryomorphaceae bacterium]
MYNPIGGVITSELQAQQAALPAYIASEFNDCFNRRITIDPNNGSFAVSGDICNQGGVEFPNEGLSQSMINNMGSYLVKYDAAGRLVWQSLYECVRIIDIDMDSNGDIYFTGEKHADCDHRVTPFLNTNNTNNFGLPVAHQGFVIAKVNGADGVCETFDFYEGGGGVDGNLIGNALTIDKENDILYVAVQPCNSLGSEPFGILIDETSIFKIDDVNTYPFAPSIQQDMDLVIHPNSPPAPLPPIPSIIGFSGGGIAQIEYHDGHLYGVGWGPGNSGKGSGMNGDGESEVFIFDDDLTIIDFEDFNANAFNLKIWPYNDDLVLAVCGIFENDAVIAGSTIFGTFQHGFLAAWEVSSQDFSTPIDVIPLDDDPNTFYTTGIIPFSMDFNQDHLLVSSVGSSQFISAYEYISTNTLTEPWPSMEMAIDNTGLLYDFATGVSYGNEIGSQRAADIAYQPSLDRFVFIGNNNTNQDMVFGSTTFSPDPTFFTNNTYIIAIEDHLTHGHWRLQNETFDYNEISFDVFPNPSSGVLQVNSSIETIIIVLNLEGKTILKQNIQSGENTLDLSDLSSGLYLLRDEENKFPIKKISIFK